PKPQFASGRGVGPNMKRSSNSSHSGYLPADASIIWRNSFSFLRSFTTFNSPRAVYQAFPKAHLSSCPCYFQNMSLRMRFGLLIGCASRRCGLLGAYFDASAVTGAVAFEPKLAPRSQGGKADQSAKLRRASDRCAIDSHHEVPLL